MQELGFSIQCAVVSLKITVWKNSFRLSPSNLPNSLPAQLKTVHRHNDYELFLVEHGSITLHTLTENRTYTDSLLIIPPQLDHYVTADKDCSGCYLYFSIEKPHEANSSYEVLSEVLSTKETALPLSEDEHFYITHIARALSVSTGSADLPHLLTLLFSELISRLSPEQTEPVGTTEKYGRHVNTIDQYIAQHYTETVRLADLSRVLFLCPKQISRILNKEYGCTLSELLNRHRLSAACMLLRYTKMEIGEIAREVGYEYETYFYALFRKAYGITPTQYRKEANQTKGKTNV